jgi:hypothetical protein
MKLRILFLAANPVGTPRLKLEDEARAIRAEIELANPGSPFEFVPCMAARPMDLLRGLRDVRPTIVHFAGHAKTDGIYLTAEDGTAAHMTRDTLVATFGAAAQSVQIVVLNGCATASLAEALRDFVPVCVGTTAWITDEAASMFSVGFYGALAAGESVARAYLHGSAAMRFVPTDEHDKPRLCCRRNVDPDAMYMCTVGRGAYPSRVAPSIQHIQTVQGVHGAPTTSDENPAISPSMAPPTSLPIGITAVTRAAPTSEVARSSAGTDLIAPLVLLQLSDLHFGPHSRFVGFDVERLAARCRQELDEGRSDLSWREPISLVIVTGDIAEAARPPEYAIAATFFRTLANELGLSPHRFVFVPGNHDISWTKCREIEGQLEDSTFPASELRDRLDAVKLLHFEGFVSAVNGGT